MSRKTDSARWVRLTESASLRAGAQGLAQAVERWSALPTAAARMALVREIVATRAQELTLAYRNVIAVVAGFRARTNTRGEEELHPEPCVVFVVKRKWPAGQEEDPDQRLPTQLLTYGPATAAGSSRALFAVPTDVQLARRHAAPLASAAARAGVDVTDASGQITLPGSLTCAVRLDGASAANQRWALSAMHVLSPVPSVVKAVAGASVSALAAPGPVRATSAAWGGHLDFNAGFGFDAQLARVSDAGWFDQAFAGMDLSPLQPFVPGPDVFDELATQEEFRVVVHESQPHGPAGPRGPVRAQFSKYVGAEWPILYDVRFLGSVTVAAIHHQELLLLAVRPDSPPTVSGDSGSAVVCPAPDGRLTLVGMFIASGRDEAARDAYVLPAWQLFDLDNWRRLPPGTRRMTPSFSIA